MIRHRYIGLEPEQIIAIVARPDRVIPGREEDEVWYYDRGAGPSVWLRVVVHFDGEEGTVATAFPRRSFP